jgi:hypothetical protein
MALAARKTNMARRRFTIAPRSPDLCSCEKNLSGYVNWITIKNSIARENSVRC